MSHESRLSFAYDDPDSASRVRRAIQPEVGDIDEGRSRVVLDCEDSRIHLTVHASDLVALRASLNTWCTLVDVAERTSVTVDPPE